MSTTGYSNNYLPIKFPARLTDCRFSSACKPSVKDYCVYLEHQNKISVVFQVPECDLTESRELTHFQ